MLFLNGGAKVRYIFVFGGLGNQLFQYSLACFIHDMGFHNIKLIDCTSIFKKRRRYRLQNGQFETVELQKFQLIILLAIVYFLRTLPLPRIREYFGFYYDSGIPIQEDQENLLKMRFFYGYWQEIFVANYCRDKIETLFRGVEHLTSDRKVIGVHCRRGDFISNPKTQIHNVTSKEYFEKGVAQVACAQPGWKVKVFTDDKEWCVKNLSFSQMDNTFSDHSELGDIKDFLHLRTSGSFILSNSTFGWWASFTSKFDSKKIVLPNMWLKNLCTNKTKIYDEKLHSLLNVKSS